MAPKNVMAAAELSAEQQETVDLFALPSSQELMLFEFNTDKSYRGFEVWVEAYQDGELIGRLAGVSTYRDTGEELNGRVAIIAHKTRYRLSVDAFGCRKRTQGKSLRRLVREEGFRFVLVVQFGARYNIDW